ncbi:cation/H(+) antiporter 20 [Salvia divinorum]|uniref:Cation/H(+) antiporter 20 n=1 Tax=Salvia divinorum TaxID=28513 RepID=A0ABD1GAW2_SALDI
MAVNVSSIKTSSNGVWQGDNPLDFALPLLILQTTLIITVCRLLAVFLKPLRQPQVIAEMLGGILLGPSVFGRNEEYMHRIFPKWSAPILESVAGFGLLFFLFLVGLELDLSSIRRSGWRATAIAAAGILSTFVLGVGVAFIFRRAIEGADAVGFAQYLIFMAVALSITAFPVLARVLAELKLLTTRIGETAMAAAALNDVAAWISLALAVALAGNGGDGARKSPLISIWVLLSGVVFVTFMMVAIKPAMKWVERRSSARRGTAEDEAYICLTLGGVLAAGLVTDLIGLHAIFGAFVFGLTIPKGGDLASRSMARIEDFVSGLLLPLYFASSGLNTDVTKIQGVKAWGLLALVITAACTGKIIGTFVAARMCMIPARESITLGVLMNTKGLVELIVLNIGKEKKVLNEEAFAILVLMALVTTFLTTPAVISIYQPGHAATGHRCLQSASAGELRILACVHGPANIPSLVNLTESTRSADKSSRLKVYVMHLVELTERSSSIIMVRRFTQNGFPLINRLRGAGTHLADRAAAAFQAYSNLGRVSIRPATAISALATMHEDICHVAEEKAVAMIVLPFHRQWVDINDDDVVETVGHRWSGVTQRVLKEAPCTVAVLVDRGYGASTNSTGVQNVCVLFFGGTDGVEALELGGRMVEHPAVKLAVISFINTATGKITAPEFKENDEAAVAKFMHRMEGRVELIEKTAIKIVDEVIEIGRDGGYDLIIVGKGRPCSTTIPVAELGPIGNVLASSYQGVTASVLVVQRPIREELSLSKSPLGEGGHDQNFNLA